MKALLSTAKRLQLTHDLTEAETKANEVKVRLHYASLNPTDIALANGDYDLFLRLYGAKSPVRTGLEFSGTVMQDSQCYKKGDRIFGYTHLMKGPKTHQQTLSINQEYVALMPSELDFQQAAAAPIGLQTSYVAWQQANLKPGDKVLINGASGGVGLYAIQIAKSMQAVVTAVAGTKAQSLMQQLGADQVIDYKRTNIANLTQKFDAIFDLSCKKKLKTIRLNCCSKSL